METIRGKKDAYLTVYLALSMAVLLALCLVLLEGARRNGAALEAECMAEMSLNSILAEYHKELFEQYNLFALDASYGTNYPSPANTERHLCHYLQRNFSLEDLFLSDYWYRDFFALTLKEASLTGISILTDQEGGVFRRRAVEAIEADVGLTVLKELSEWLKTVEINSLEDGSVEQKKAEIDRQIQEYNGKEIQLPDGQWKVVEIENPTWKLEENKRKGILKLVIEDQEQISQRSIAQEALIMDRIKKGEANSGNMDIHIPEEESLADQFLFREYLMRYMGNYGAENAEGALLYQLEYLIAGKENDTENLRGVANRLLALREAANALYLFSDSEKSMEAELVAGVIATLLAVPEITELLKVSLLLGWAYAESLYDVKTLLEGGKIPLIKDDATWHFGLQGALEANISNENFREETGLSYEDYLRIFLMLTDTDKLTGRAMNLVEADIRLTAGNADFRLDGCFDRIEAYICVESAYGYQFELTRQKSY